MSELVASVDDFDQVIEIVPRKVANEKGYNVRIAAVLVFNSKGEIILQKISKNKKKDAGKWNYSAAGHVLAGEDYPTAALRELEEELGIKGEIEDYIGLSRTIDPVTNQKKSFHFNVKSQTRPSCLMTIQKYGNFFFSQEPCLDKRLFFVHMKANDDI